jgi:hypothetical protein
MLDGGICMKKNWCFHHQELPTSAYLFASNKLFVAPRGKTDVHGLVA